MTPLSAGLLAFFATGGGTLLGLCIASRLPEHHLAEQTSRAVSVGMAVVGSLTALVLGLLVSNASNAFNTQSGEIETIAVNILKLDRQLRAYGALAEPIRVELAGYARAKVQELSNPGDGPSMGLETLHRLEAVSGAVLGLSPGSERERAIHARVVSLTDQIEDTRWLLAERTAAMVVPTSVLIMLIGWLALLFASFGMFAPRNATAMTFLMLSAAAIAGCIFIILALGSPGGGGFVDPSVEPIIRVVAQMQIE
ncbi:MULTISPECIES: hypothetical protein [Methylosinus]|uniref:DUF4239 domain-containing protein n=1 Tax=Methylosinus trichosporium (strain ATCC 35070 / NCIMB 11131 / UNIQEM 75 / OB3b) TaxID=595536 RepID=A0A2D2D4G8_METT3|nr:MULTISPECIES: hypothetical protein [Methylosinus]ATQ69910.1 hypothetical protein CQW49_19990 [Methylosinus trichosporium OB3b]OBS53875.1 hypothetical protein A8B73_03665 [Methylosinus sp. 3S-1]